MKIQIPTKFQPLFKRNKWRNKVFYGGRGGAKSWAFAVALLVMGMQSPLRILCARELQISISDSVHKLLFDMILKYDWSDFYEVQQTKIVGRNGTEFIFKGLKHNSREIKSIEGIDICWVEEAQMVSENSWELLIPSIRKNGSEIWVCFNPKNPTDATWQKFCLFPDDDTLVVKVGWQDNPFFPDVLNKERLKLQKQDPEAYKHIWDGEFDTRFNGAVYAKQMANVVANGRMISGLYDPELPVHTAWDLGYDDATAIWFWQRAGLEVRWIDYYENSNEDTLFYCNVLKERGYNYGYHYAPHDAANKLMAAGGRSIVQQAHEQGIKMHVVNATTQQNGIEALRKVLNNSWFDVDKTKDGVQCLNSYHFEYDEERQVFKSHPRHDWSSHGADAAEIVGQVLRDDVKQEKREKPRFLNDMTANEVFWGDISSNSTNDRI